MPVANKHLQSGFTLVETMIVTLIISILSIGFASYLYQQSRQTNLSQSKQNVAQLQYNVLTAAGKPDSLLKSETLPVENQE